MNYELGIRNYELRIRNEKLGMGLRKPFVIRNS